MAKKKTATRSAVLRNEIVRNNRLESRLSLQLAKLQRESQCLLDELQGLCPHARVYEFNGELISDSGDLVTDLPMRVCAGCNLIEHGSYKKLTAAPKVTAPYARMGEFRVLGLLLA